MKRSRSPSEDNKLTKHAHTEDVSPFDNARLPTELLQLIAVDHVALLGDIRSWRLVCRASNAWVEHAWRGILAFRTHDVSLQYHKLGSELDGVIPTYIQDALEVLLRRQVWTLEMRLFREVIGNPNHAIKLRMEFDSNYGVLVDGVYHIGTDVTHQVAGVRTYISWDRALVRPRERHSLYPCVPMSDFLRNLFAEAAAYLAQKRMLEDDE